MLDLGWCEVSDAALASLASRCASLHTLSLAYCEQITDTGIALLCRACTEIANLDVGGCTRLSGAALNSIIGLGSQLQSLDLGACKRLVSDDGLLALAHACPKLRTLNLRLVEGVSDDAMEVVQQLCVSVQVRR